MEKTIIIFNDKSDLEMEIEIVKDIEQFVSREDMKTVNVTDLHELEKCLEKGKIQLILAVMELSGKGWCAGIETINGIRKISRVPMIVVSGQKAETAKIMALNAGADDYVTDECNPLVLLARINSQFRRYTRLINSGEDIAHIYRVGGLEINDLTREVSVEGRQVRLTPIEYDILKLLVQERGRVISIDKIYESIWHMRAVGADNTIAVHVRHIREKIENNPREPRYLKVVWGTGYKVG
jgi:DNA-binding response OmpR family regulator